MIRHFFLDPELEETAWNTDRLRNVPLAPFIAFAHVDQHRTRLLEHAARLRGCTHIVLEVAENNEEALRFYRRRNFHKLDAAVFLSRKLDTRGDLLSPRKLKTRAKPE